MRWLIVLAALVSLPAQAQEVPISTSTLQGQRNLGFDLHAQAMAQVEKLAAQVEELKKENEELKTKIKGLEKPDEK